MQGTEDEDEGSVLMYVTEVRIPKATQQIAFVQQSRTSRVKVKMQLSNRRVATKHLPRCNSPIA